MVGMLLHERSTADVRASTPFYEGRTAESPLPADPRRGLCDQGIEPDVQSTALPIHEINVIARHQRIVAEGDMRDSIPGCERSRSYWVALSLRRDAGSRIAVGAITETHPASLCE